MTLRASSPTALGPASKEEEEQPGAARRKGAAGSLTQGPQKTWAVPVVTGRSHRRVGRRPSTQTLTGAPSEVLSVQW